LESEDAFQKRGGFTRKGFVLHFVSRQRRDVEGKDLPERKIKQKRGGERYAEIQFP